MPCPRGGDSGGYLTASQDVFPSVTRGKSLPVSGFVISDAKPKRSLKSTGARDLLEELLQLRAVFLLPLVIVDLALHAFGGDLIDLFLGG